MYFLALTALAESALLAGPIRLGVHENRTSLRILVTRGIFVFRCHSEGDIPQKTPYFASRHSWLQRSIAE